MCAPQVVAELNYQQSSPFIPTSGKKKSAVESTHPAVGHLPAQTSRQQRGGVHSVVTIVNPQAERLTALIFTG